MPVLVADEDLVGVEALAPEGFEIVRYHGRSIPAALCQVADAVYVRSTVRLDLTQFSSALRFVGTATIGTEHLPLEALRARGVRVASAPGCNALAVTDYVLATIARWVQVRERGFDGLCLGLIGYGQIGRRLAARAQALGCQVLVSDPPAAAHARCPQDQPWEQVLSQADVLSVHVPLTTTGPWPTLGLLSRAGLAPMRSGGLVINAARGRLLTAETVIQRPDLDWALDVFPEEPLISESLLAALWQVSPHIAGHSFAGKWRGTQHIAEAHRQSLGQPPTGLPVQGGSYRAHADWADILACCPLQPEDQQLRAALQGITDPVTRAEAFDRCRRAYVLREESIQDLAIAL